MLPCEENHIASASCENRHIDGDACANNALRLNRAIAQTGTCSRRKADELVLAGRISINGVQEKNPGTKVTGCDSIELDGSPLVPSPPLAWYMLNKPVHTICTLSDPQGRRTVLDLLPDQLRKPGLFPVGRLDYFSEGLLLLTNDGELANRLMHPRYHLAKTYRVIVRGRVADAAISSMENGMSLEDGTKVMPVEVKARKLAHGNTSLELVLRQGLNRQIRRMCAVLGITILKLKRIRAGSLELGDLPPGAFRKLTRAEVNSLYQEVHLADPVKSGFD